mmetsp:Transcript_4370/g.12319  ORF Transcript_4370/g.12319 Transcript_4370/m.12319 type:complete len:435 (+) Transcript_4370:397-1701(+)
MRKLLLWSFPNLLHQINHGVLSIDRDLTGPPSKGDKYEATHKHIQEIQTPRPVGSTARDDLGNVLDIIAHKHMELQHISLQRNPPKEFQRRAVQFSQIFRRIANHEPTRHGHPEDVGVHRIVHELVADGAEAIPPKPHEGGAGEALDPLGRRALHSGLAIVGPLHVGLEFGPDQAGPDTNQSRVLVGLEAEEVLVGEEFEEIDGGCFIKDDVDRSANKETTDAAFPVGHAAPLEGAANPARCHGNEESGGVEGDDVVQLEGDAQEDREEEGEVVDAKPHRYGPINGEILGLIEIEEVAKAGHPYVGADEASNFIVGGIHAVVVVHNKRELHPTLPLFRLRPAQELHAALRVGLPPLHGGQAHDEHDAADRVEHGGIVILIAMVRFGEGVAQMGDEEDDRDLALGQEEVLLGGPAIEEGAAAHAFVFGGGGGTSL